jgi:hypothetical protein
MFGPLKQALKTKYSGWRKMSRLWLWNGSNSTWGVLCRRGTSAVVSMGCLWALFNSLHSDQYEISFIQTSLVNNKRRDLQDDPKQGG